MDKPTAPESFPDLLEHDLAASGSRITDSEGQVCPPSRIAFLLASSSDRISASPRLSV